MFGTFTWLLNLPFACSGPGGWFALQQSGEIVWVSFELGIAITIAIAAGNVLRRRPSLRLLSAVVFVLFIPGCSGIGGGSDCGYFARELCYGNLGILAALCTGEFLFWKRTSFLLAASRLKSRHLESGTRIGPDTDEYFSPDDAVTMTPPPLMVAETSSRTSLVQDIQSWDEAAGSADRGNETTPPPHRWQIRWKLSRVKALLSLAIGLVVALTARVVVPDWLAPNQYHFDVPLAVHLRCLPLCQQ
ncbi:MAG TPA: hypothetical protein VL860_06785, partial [Planctomycetota bacterium]|nr:hypothetical protein [Planctomycetota bacterium]